MTAQQPGDVKVLFLAGKGRSGGTLLASLLGQLPGFFNIGELNRLWDWGLVSNFRCGCGLPVQECPTWHAILEEADAAARRARGIAPPRCGPDRPRAGVGRALAAHGCNCCGRDRASRRAGRHSTGTRRRRRRSTAAIAKVTGARVVVDSSRLPIEPVALGLVPGVDVRDRAGHPRPARRRLLVEAIEDHDRP